MPTRPVSRLIAPVLSVAAALLAVVAAALLAVAATGPAHAGPTGPAVVTGPAPVTVTVVPAALTSTGDYYRHDLATVIRIPDPDPASSSYTPPVCLSRRVLLNTGTYVYGTSFGWQGESYDREGLFVRGGFYIWQDCVFASASGGYLQLSRLTMNGSPDDGHHDTAVIFHHRDTPDWRDADDAGRYAWGSFLNRTD